MQHKSNIVATVEALEDRRLLSATLPHHSRPAPFPNLVGQYNGSYQFADGESGSFNVLLTSQHGGHFAGTSTQGALQSIFTGTVNRRGGVHFHYKAVRYNEVATGQGVTNSAHTTLTAAVVVRVGGGIITGTFSLVRQAEG